MSSSLLIDGFKCFSGEIFDLNNITILSGNNGAGKSSVIQTILLIRQAIENNSYILNERYNLDHWNNSPVFLNESFELALGVADEIYNKKAVEGIRIKLDAHSFTIPLPNQDDALDSVIVKHELLSDSPTPFLLYKEFYYLNAERIGPRYNLENHHTNFVHCGNKGELTAQTFLKKNFYKVNNLKTYQHSGKDNFQIQVDQWLNYICPNTTVKVEETGKLMSQIRLRNNKIGHTVAATNIGFGISYLLPIIVEGLIAEEGRVFIVENPEAHLHPKAQSNLGFFLGQMSTAGVKIIIETHSEHIINGIRRACLSQLGLDYNTINIYFFDGFKENSSLDCHLIKILKNGDLSDFPMDFFDQTRQDLFEILKLSKR